MLNITDRTWAVNITGFLVNFSGTGNQVNISNGPLMPLDVVNPQRPPHIAFQNGATSAQVQGGSGTAIKSPGGNAFNVARQRLRRDPEWAPEPT